MQKLLSHVRAAIQKYNMIEEGDRIAIGVSGGKDSVALLYSMAQLRHFYPVKFSIYAVTLDMGVGGKRNDFSEITELCRKLDVPYIIKNTEIGKIVFEERKETNPCSLCAKMRRGVLHDTAKELGCNKIALGHHLDDVVQTFYMNLFNEGRIGCFSPVTYLSRKDLYVIRPMIFAFERDVVRAVKSASLPVVKSICPNDGISERKHVKALVASLEKEYKNLRIMTIGALQRASVDGW